MDIREQIRNRMTEDTRKKSINSNWDIDTQPHLYDLDVFLRKSGYRLLDTISQKDRQGNPHYELVIGAKEKSYLYPDITHDPLENNFYINVVEYGEIESSDLREIIKGYENALGVISHLEELDISILQSEEEEEGGEK